jgi:uncharacterized integral membrane protein
VKQELFNLPSSSLGIVPVKVTEGTMSAQQVQEDRAPEAAIPATAARSVDIAAKSLADSLEAATKALVSAERVADKGPPYTMLIVGLLLIFAVVGLVSVDRIDSDEYVAGLVVGAILLITAGMVRLLENITAVRRIAEHASESTSAQERVATTKVLYPPPRSSTGSD